ncbi:hypothetical protein GW17_00056000 [Ensete ventricosum]|nr:hypothetical protein GW17_00056000 [Ensete ventricosum]
MEGSPRRRSSASSSPEFEFLVISNSPAQLLTADELFANGVVLPLHLLSLRQPHPGPAGTELEPEPEPEPDPDPSLPPPPSPTDDITASISCSPMTGSKRWKDIFRVGEKKAAEAKERTGSSSSGAAEPNIGLWPFSRSRSAGNPAAGGRGRRSTGRKVSSTPCSRSNSRGEYSAWPATAAGARRWAANPGRAGGVPVGPSSPVWQIRRPEHRDKITGGKTGSGGAGIRVLNLKVNILVGFRRGEGSCMGDDNVGLTTRARTAGHSGGSLFSLRALFSKVY